VGGVLVGVLGAAAAGLWPLALALALAAALSVLLAWPADHPLAQVPAGVLAFAAGQVVPRLAATGRELARLLDALGGRYGDLLAAHATDPGDAAALEKAAAGVEAARKAAP
jgi:hypothetical protein